MSDDDQKLDFKIGDKVRIKTHPDLSGVIARASDYTLGKWVVAMDHGFRGKSGCVADGVEVTPSELIPFHSDPAIDVSRVYPDHRPWDLEPHYTKHVSAMTSKGLHSKHDIAVQLAWRDQEIERLQFQVKSATQQHEWVLASECLPIDGQPVWFVVRGDPKIWEGDVGAWDEGCYFNFDDGYWSADRVSYWMPRRIEQAPPPPKDPT